jgi:transcriptional regulator with GAF, ATPase, and Fis domain
VIQEGEVEPLGGEAPLRVDVRIVAATNRPLATIIASGEFREDLYYRLSPFPLEIPPLRDRGPDLPQLTAFLLGEICERLGLELPNVAWPVLSELRSSAEVPGSSSISQTPRPRSAAWRLRSQARPSRAPSAAA